MKHGAWRIAVLGMLATGSASAQSLNLYGNSGLIDMPDADMFSDGTVAASVAGFDGASRVTLNFQIAPRLEGSFRYASMTGFDATGDVRSDQQFDLKFLLAEEGQYMPAIAVGVRDLIGSGSNASEYLVASKSFDPGITVTAGLGWGRMASVPAFDNPFGGSRPAPTTGADRGAGGLFQGDDIGLFGGIAWQLPKDGWRLKAEYSSDAYLAEAANGDRDIASNWNFGIEKSIGAGIDAGLYYLNGSDIGFRLSFTGDPSSANAPQDFLPGPPPLKPRSTANRSVAWQATPGIDDKIFTALGEALAPEGIIVDGGTVSGTEIDIRIINSKMSRAPKAVGRTARVMALALPPSVETFNITLVEQGVPVTTTTVNRSDMERLVNTYEAAPESWTRFARSNALPLPDDAWRRDVYPAFSYALTPSVPFGLLGDGLSFDIVLNADATYRVSRNFALTAAVTQSVLGGFDDIASVAGPLPQVRSNFASYQSNGPILERLTGDYVGKLAPSLYARASVGYLERMYGGISTELLWKDTSSPVAVGLELNYAMQRDPDDVFGFNDYDVVTGHGSIYWDTDWYGVTARLDAGRYLAGDWGATLSLGRRFANGWEVTGHITQTDADTSGSDGRFDKGVRLTIPLQWTTPFATRRKVDVPFLDFARDDGARLAVSNRLYPIVREAGEQRLGDNWEAFWQ